MRVKVALPSGDVLCYPVESAELDTLENIRERISNEEGVPAEQQMFRTSHTLQQITDLSITIQDLHEQGNFRGDEVRLDLIVDLSGAGSSNCDIGNFEPAVKLLCFQCSLTGEWKRNQLCCCKCNCSIQ